MSSPLVVAVISTGVSPARAELRGVTDAARRMGWTLETIDTATFETSLSAMRPLLARADGVVCRLRDTLRDGTLASLGVPLVAIDSGRYRAKPETLAPWAHVLSDQEAIGEAAADELLATGRRCFAFVPMLRRYPWAKVRGEAFLARIRAADCDARLYEPATEWDWLGERDALAPWLAALPRPFGVFAANDLIARLVYEACRVAGLAIPGDAAVVGADDDETLCLSLDPPLPSIRIDFEGAGRLAAEKLAALMGRERPGKPRQRQILRYGVTGVARRASTRIERAGMAPALVSALDFIALHYSDPFIGAADVARAMGLGRRQADRLFAATGKSIRARVEETRLAAAKSMLAAGDDPIAAVAANCGFASSNYFAYSFRKATGLSPTAWRVRQVRR